MIPKVKEVYCFKNIIKTPDGTKLDATNTAVLSHTDSITGELYINSGSGISFSRSNISTSRHFMFLARGWGRRDARRWHYDKWWST